MLDDLADADGRAERRVAVVLLLPFGAVELGHGDLSRAVEGVVDHLAVAVFEDVEWEDLLGEEGDLVEREEGDGVGEVDADGDFLGHGQR